MAMINDIKNSIADLMKMLPDRHIADKGDFKAWGKEFTDLIVSISYSIMNDT
jgi:hypothetical protein